MVTYVVLRHVRNVNVSSVRTEMMVYKYYRWQHKCTRLMYLCNDKCYHTFIGCAVVVSAFSDCKGLTSLTLPTSLKCVGNDAFAGCEGLTSLTLPKSLKSIGASAFSDCKGLTSLTLPKSLKSVGNEGAHVPHTPTLFGGCW